MAVETQSDLNAFFNPEEFGVNCILGSKVGDVPFNGIVSKYNAEARLGAPANSSVSPFAVGAADFSLTTIQIMCRWDTVSLCKADDTVTVLSGEYAGEYRLKTPMQNGQIATLLVNKR